MDTFIRDPEVPPYLDVDSCKQYVNELSKNKSHNTDSKILNQTSEYLKMVNDNYIKKLQKYNKENEEIRKIIYRNIIGLEC